ncbi:peptidase S8 [Actinoplanes ianthinogenes]|uniref:Peptidase S8 n=1 Tax=Actinoplanes ianthinogenes TaxID=122358 RepID=A0ABM7M726_9ACTN|nr:S8 family serine peptidase [Actinoplanes ianthinogenes]BCJ47426.1 peptidase S8 [Actinoplanes ianthinogenes]GGR01712.1 peptidase S8 [Actinoplanes ianthinogenes]
MNRRWRLSTAAVAALLTPLAGITLASPAHADPTPRPSGTLRLEKTLTPTGSTTSAKTSTGKLARTDPSLLGRKDTATIPVLVKLDYDSIATYGGDVKGYAPTSPSVTGRPLAHGQPERKYEQHVAGVESEILGAIGKRVPDAKVGQKLRTVYGGVALTVPANEVGKLLTVPGVVAVQKDAVNQPLADPTSEFIGASGLYSQLGGAADAGKGIIFGSVDTGVWPEHPSFADNGNLGAPPAKPDGTPRACDFGDNPITPATDTFTCNNKLIGGKAFLTTYLAENPPDRYTNARDAEGHGTHTASSAVGDPVASAKVFGTEAGPVNGIAPGAWLSVYRACGLAGCYSSDTAAAIEQAILDGVKVINFSIGGGGNPYTDASELAMLDAYAAGVFVSASAGNSGPDAGTTEHVSPWVTTVAASSETRTFRSTLTVTSTDGASATFTGSSITAGAGPAPMVAASTVPYNDILCAHPAPPGIFVGKIVVCQSGGVVNGSAIGRVQKGFNVMQGGAAGMVLYNPAPAFAGTDNHFLPTVHLADGTALRTFADAHPGITAQFTPGAPAQGKGDVMASFSSRGPGGQFLKPDVTAPGVHILAGDTPTPEELPAGPQGQYYQAISGTSMSAPQVAGSAILQMALHPDWTPGQIKSALMTTAATAVVKEDGSTPADPFDDGAGRVQVNVAADPGLTFDETADRMAALGSNPVNAAQLNVPSVNAPVMPGALTVTRTAKNVSGKTQTYRVETTAPTGSAIAVVPPVFTVKAGATVPLKISIVSNAPTAQYFGQVRLVPVGGGQPALHLPVAFVPKQGAVTLAQSCTPTTINLQATSTCTVTATNTTFTDTTADLTSVPGVNAPVVSATGATVSNPLLVQKKGAALPGAKPGKPSIGSGVSPGGYIPLDALGVAPTGIGDEEQRHLDVTPFLFNGVTYHSVSVDSNGYLIPGGSGAPADNNCCDIVDMPNPATPNNVLAPFWTDLDGSGAQGLYAAEVTDGVSHWTVVEWRVNVFGTSSVRRFQVWLGHNGVQDISYTYDPGTLQPPFGQPFRIGVEEATGTYGGQLPAGAMPTGDLVVTSTDPVAAGSVSYTFTQRGLVAGTLPTTTGMTSPLVPGTTVVTTPITVTNHR